MLDINCSIIWKAKTLFDRVGKSSTSRQGYRKQISMTLKLQFDPNQPYQLDAVENVARLFEGLPRQTANFTLGDEINPNLSPFESLSESWLYDNLRQIQ